MTGVQSFARGSLALIAALLLVFSAAGCRKRSPNNNGNSNSLTTSANSEEAKRNAQTLVDQAKELYKNDEDERAAQVLEQAIKLDPNNAEAHLRLGMSYAALDRKPDSDDEYKKAIELFKKKVEADSKDASTFFYLGEAYNFLHRDEDAARNYREATQLNEKDEEAWYQLGMVQIKLARYSEAVNAFQKALELDANDYRASDGLEEAKEGAQRIREGKKHNEEMLKKQGNANANGNGNSNSSSRPNPKRTP
ncbi:MAG TPA: tetratricopeptide repeat protein [Pyrinomonadaceae bacterium]|nr:tetratricopeptide repeat protein [Pyrinomonadaceae bacterium]